MRDSGIPDHSSDSSFYFLISDFLSTGLLLLDIPASLQCLAYLHVTVELKL